MMPNTSAVFLVVGDTAAEQVVARLAPYGAQVVTATIGTKTGTDLAKEFHDDLAGRSGGV
jgi:hypothetical protein